MSNKVKLTVLGFSFNQTESGTYGLVLAEENSLRRLMIVVGAPEAQSIAFKLHETEPPRPLTHDLFQTLMNKLDIFLKEVIIYKYDNGVFYSKLHLIGPNNEPVTIESRTSDAIAVALRMKSPIYTTESIMQELAVVVTELDDETEEPSAPQVESNESSNDKKNYSLFNRSELETMLSDAIKGEDYELASVLRDELDKKNNKRPE